MMLDAMKKRIADVLKFVGRAMPAGLVKPFVDFIPKFRRWHLSSRKAMTSCSGNSSNGSRS